MVVGSPSDARRDEQHCDSRPGSSSELRLQPGRLVGGRYQVLEVLAYGGMSVVHLALDVQLRRRVALKMLRPSRPGAADGGLGDEGEALVGARFSHPALVTVYDAGTTTAAGATVEFVVLEYAEGGDLRDRIFDTGAVPWQEVLQLAVDVCDGLAQLHAAGFVHRDVKPANVLITGRHANGAPRAKLADFGLSSTARRAGATTFGTAAYISPEQAQGASGGPESDVYSLGLVLLELLTARTEFPGRVEESAFARLDRRPSVPTGVPEPLASVIRAMTETRLDRRPTAVAAGGILRDALRSLQDRADDDERAARRGTEREAALEGLGVLEWPPERTFDAALAVAVQLSAADDGCVVIPAQDGARLFALHGSRLPPRLASPDPLVPPDVRMPWSRSDLGDAELPFMAEAGIRAVAGAPLVSTTGVVLGTICVFGADEGGFGPELLQALESVAVLVVHDLELRVAARRAVLGR